MMEKERLQQLMALTGDIRDEFIEEADKPANRNWSKRIAAAAAVLVLLIGIFPLLGRNDSNTEPVPFFAVRVNAADGRTKMLDEIGDTIRLQTGTSDLFPGRTVYYLDISLEYYDGDFEDLDLERLWVRHSDYVYSPTVKQGESDSNLYMQWLSREEDGMYGIRLTGWVTKEKDYVSFKIWDKDGTVICEKELLITWSEGIFYEGYQVEVRRSFSYRADMTTDELIDETLRQDYTMELLASSDFTGRIPLMSMCGFKELTKRPDAGTKLLERLERMAAGEVLYPIKGGLLGELAGQSNDHIVRNMLSWSEFYDLLTDEEKERLANNPLSPGVVMEPPVSLFFFTDHELFAYEMLLDGLQWDDSYELEVAYHDIKTIRNTDNIVALSVSRDGGKGWEIKGWFDEPTEVTLTAIDQDGAILRRDVILVTPLEEGYQIDVLESTK